MTPAILAVVLALAWVAISGGFTLANLGLGLVVGAIIAWLLRDRLAQGIAPQRFAAVLRLAAPFIGELFLSALGVARLAVSPSLQRRLKPAIIDYPLQVKSDAGITLLANLITLTPGTLTVDVSPDRKHLLLHVLSLDDKQARLASIRLGFERRVMDIFL